jgi:serine protease Do
MKYLRRMLVLAVLLLSANISLAQPVKDPNALRNAPKVLQVFREVVAKPSESTVRVLADGKEVAFGTIVDANGWILTKWSEIEHKRDKITVRLKDGTVLKAEIKGVMDDEKAKAAYDLAMLKVEAADLTPIEWANSKIATVGRWVASPGLGANPVAVGVVSVATRKWAAQDQPPKLDVSKSGYLGVGNLQDAEDGVKVGDVPAKTPAEKAGLKANDIIYEAAGRKTNDTETLINTIGRLKPGDEVLLRVRRGEEDLEITVKLAPRPKNLQGNPQETMGTTLSRRRGGFPIILQHDSGVRPEDCGGPLVDLDGKTVGINIARAGRTETYAIPAETIQPLLADLKSGKLAPIAELIDSDFVIRKTASLTDKDTIDKKRPMMASKRFVRTEEVKLSKDVTYIIEMVAIVGKDGKQLDPYLILEDANGKKLAEDDDSGGDPNAKGTEWNAKIVFRAPTDGVYRVVCTTFNPGETGGYTLRVRRQTEVKEKK